MAPHQLTPLRLFCSLANAPAQEDVHFWDRIGSWLEHHMGVDPLDAIYLPDGSDKRGWGYADCWFKTKSGRLISIFGNSLDQTVLEEGFFRAVAVARFSHETYFLVMSSEVTPSQRSMLRKMAHEFDVGLIVVEDPFDWRSFHMVSSAPPATIAPANLVFDGRGSEDEAFVRFRGDLAVHNFSIPRAPLYTPDRVIREDLAIVCDEPSIEVSRISRPSKLPNELIGLLNGQEHVEISLYGASNAFGWDLGCGVGEAYDFLAALEVRGVGFEPDVRGWGRHYDSSTPGRAFLVSMRRSDEPKCVEEATLVGWIIRSIFADLPPESVEGSRFIAKLHSALMFKFRIPEENRKRLKEQVGWCFTSSIEQSRNIKVYLAARTMHLSLTSRQRLREKCVQVWDMVDGDSWAEEASLFSVMDAFLPIVSCVVELDEDFAAPSPMTSSTVKEKERLLEHRYRSNLSPAMNVPSWQAARRLDAGKNEEHDSWMEPLRTSSGHGSFASIAENALEVIPFKPSHLMQELLDKKDHPDQYRVDGDWLDDFSRSRGYVGGASVMVSEFNEFLAENDLGEDIFVCGDIEGFSINWAALSENEQQWRDYLCNPV